MCWESENTINSHSALEDEGGKKVRLIYKSRQIQLTAMVSVIDIDSITWSVEQAVFCFRLLGTKAWCLFEMMMMLQLKLMKIIKQAHKMFSHSIFRLFYLVWFICETFPSSPIMEDCGQNDPFRDYDVNTHQQMGYVFTLLRGIFRRIFLGTTHSKVG